MRSQMIWGGRSDLNLVCELCVFHIRKEIALHGMSNLADCFENNKNSRGNSLVIIWLSIYMKRHYVISGQFGTRFDLKRTFFITIYAYNLEFLILKSTWTWNYFLLQIYTLEGPLLIFVNFCLTIKSVSK